MMRSLTSRRLKRLPTVLLCLCLCVSLFPITLAAYESDQEEERGESSSKINTEPHPDVNLENYENMIYVGRIDGETGQRVGFDASVSNGVTYIFGTAFDETHKEIEEEDLLHHHHSIYGDIADRSHPTKTREEILQEMRHKNISSDGPKPFGHVDEHPLDGGVMPPKIVHADPFFMDATLVTNKEFGKFVRATYYETEAEQFDWSFVLSSFLPSQSEEEEVDPEAEHWVAVKGAYWRRPEGPDSSYKFRENHPVVHVSHRDAAEYCKWMGKRLPGEREWEAAARAGNYGPNNRTLYVWGDSTDDWEKHANLWGSGTFPYENHAEDGWRGTSPVKTFPPNAMGFYDMTGNVWEWMRGGKHKARIVRGGSYVDSLDGSANHAATLGARSTIHGTTATGNVGFRCVKAPKRRVEHHWVYHDEEVHGTLAVEDEFGKQHHMPQRGWEDQFDPDEDEFDEEGEKLKKRKVVKPRERISTEL